MPAKLTRLTHKIAIQLNLVAESRKLLDTHLYTPAGSTYVLQLLSLRFYALVDLDVRLLQK